MGYLNSLIVTMYKLIELRIVNANVVYENGDEVLINVE